MSNWQNTQWLAACALALLASAPAHAQLLVAKSHATELVVGSSGAQTVTQSVVFNAADFSGAADDLVQKLTVGIDFIKCKEALSTPLPAACSDQASADNASVSQIGFSLTDPVGTQIDLVFPDTSTTFGSYSDASPGGRIQVTFDDAAVTLVGFSNPSFMSGTFYPEGFLADAIGHHATGTWNLAITNAGAGAPLGVARFTVNVNVKEKQGTGTDLPEPGTLALLSLGLAGVLAHRRRAWS